MTLTINEILRLSLGELSLDGLLEKALDLVLAVPDLMIERRGAVFLAEGPPQVLVLKAQRRLTAQLLATCTRVPFGKCLCGRAAASGQVEFSDDLDERHEIHHVGIRPHGHYCVPMRFADRTIGVLTCYVPTGHARSVRMEQFLLGVANALAGVIVRKQAENSLWESEQRFAQLAEQSGTFTWEVNANGFYTHISHVAEQILGYRPEEIVGKMRFYDLHPEDGREVFKEASFEVFARKQPFLNLENRMQTKAGGTIWVSTNGIPVLDRQGNTTGYRGSDINITAQKQAERSQRLSIEILRILNQPIVLADAISRIIAVIQKDLGFDAVGIRLRQGDDYPYFVQNGFSDDFLRTENTVIGRAADGSLCRNKDGSACLECTCGLVLSGHPDSKNNILTAGGSYWTNDSLSRLNLSATQDPRLCPRNRCVQEGYSSMALIPIHTEQEIVGILQLNDRRKGLFTPDMILSFEGLGAIVGIALSRHLAEDELRFSNLILSTQQDASMDGILVVAENGRIISSNRRFAEMWGIPPDILASKSDERAIQSILDKLTTPEEFVSKVKHLYEVRNEVSREEIILKDERTFERYSAPMFGADEKHYGRVWYFRDITEYKKNEQKLKAHELRLEELVGIRTAELKHANEELQAYDKARSEFVSNVSHELKTPLASLSLALDNMLMGAVGALPDRCCSYLDMMKHSCQRLRRTIDDILDMSLIDAKTLRMNRVRMPSSILVRQSVKSLQPVMDAKSLQVTLTIPDCAGFVECDRYRMTRVIVNVLGNAIKFTPEGGEIQIALRSDPATPGFLVLDIADNGVGIPAEHLPHVRERYYRVGQHVDGTGLGLSIATEILELHGGSMLLASPPPGQENGTLVSIRLPVVEPPTVFFVGGEEACKPISSKLLDHGYSVSVYRDGSDVVAAMQRKAPYVVILDLRLAGVANAGAIIRIRGVADLQYVPLIAITESNIPEINRKIMADFAIPSLKTTWSENDFLTCLEWAVVGSRR